MAAALLAGASRTAGIAAGVARALARDGWTLALTGYPPSDRREGWSSEPEELAAELGAAWHEDDLGDPRAPVCRKQGCAGVDHRLHRRGAGAARDRRQRDRPRADRH